MMKILIYILNPVKIFLCILFTFKVTLLIILLSPFLKRKNKAFSKIQKAWGFVLLKILFIKVEMTGIDKINPPINNIFLANHASYLDIILLTANLPGRIIFLGKKELNKIPIFGWSWIIAGNVAIDRKSPKAFLRSLNLAAKNVSDGYSLVVFPEGTRTIDGYIQPFKRGVTLIANKSNATIYPVTINGTFNLAKKGSKVIFPGNVQISVHDRIKPDYTKNKKEVEQKILTYSREKIISVYIPPADK